MLTATSGSVARPSPLPPGLLPLPLPAAPSTAVVPWLAFPAEEREDEERGQGERGRRPPRHDDRGEPDDPRGNARRILAGADGEGHGGDWQESSRDFDVTSMRERWRDDADDDDDFEPTLVFDRG